MKRREFLGSPQRSPIAGAEGIAGTTVLALGVQQAMLASTRKKRMASEAGPKSPKDTILLTGSTGYVGGLLRQKLESQGRRLRCLTRNPQAVKDRRENIEVCRGNALAPETLAPAMQGITTAYYLIHSMASSQEFVELDRTAAKNFAKAARDAGVERIIYLGGLGQDNDSELSLHLQSRHEVGHILRESGVPTLEFRASAILGEGSLSFEMIRSLTNRLPVMICPRWLATPTQPIASQDLIEYLFEAICIPIEESRVFEIGGRDVVTYGELIREYARAQGLRRWLISVPLLTPYLSGLWLNLVTPSTAEVGRHLIEGLRNPTIVNDDSASQVFAVKPMGIEQAIQLALHPTHEQHEDLM